MVLFIKNKEERELFNKTFAKEKVEVLKLKRIEREEKIKELAIEQARTPALKRIGKRIKKGLDTIGRFKFNGSLMDNKNNGGLI